MNISKQIKNNSMNRAKLFYQLTYEFRRNFIIYYKPKKKKYYGMIHKVKFIKKLFNV